ncbi:hypothetical protein D3C85_1751550 [compost metagenome]
MVPMRSTKAQPMVSRIEKKNIAAIMHTAVSENRLRCWPPCWKPGALAWRMARCGMKVISTSISALVPAMA